MRPGGAGVAVACALAWLAAGAHAGPEDAARLRAEGEAFAKQRRYEDAVRSFKQADLEEPRAEHDCFVALAYRRLERWGQAELFLTRCRSRLKQGEALPVWAAPLDKEIADGLTRTGHARVVVAIEPPEAAKIASVSVSAFAPDERFSPGAIFLPAGKHLVEVTANGFVTTSQPVMVEGGKERAIVVKLTPPEVTPPPPVEPEVVETKPQPSPARQPMTVVERSSGVGWFFLGAGAGALVAGGVFNYLALQNQERLQTADTDDQYEEHEGAFDAQRIGTYVGYGLGAAALGTGLYFLLKPQRQKTVWVSGAADDKGGAVFLEWKH